ncbi:phosphotransferase family protein [Alkalimarinus coralli]|uniref:phosphotransferase family protein n=1 Tax=Alkalimarinus coralli TaxID=2935863 RepID=UPI00202B87E1|nr:phosphotransferase family protein [Alkalimarinus coralli]
MSVLDEAVEVREGESLDLNKVDQYLKQVLPDLEGPLTVKQFPGGASNLTYLLQYLNRDLILRRPPFGRVAKSAHDMIRESNIMQALRPVYPFVPTVLAQCEDHDVMGCDFYVMERLVGIIPRQEMPKEVTLSEAETRQLCLNVIDKLLELHQVDYKKAGLEGIGKGEGYVKRQIEGWSDRYVKAMTDDAISFETVMAWLKDKMPDDVGTCIIHNDYRFDNVVLNPENPFDIIGVLDWEMATLGDPLMDLGNSLAYWVQADDDPQFQFMRRQPTHLKGMLTREAVIDYYLGKSGLPQTSFDFYEIYGLFRLAAIIQQLYYRYFNGQTKDKRFAGFVHAGRYLEQRCLKLIEKSTL